MARRVDLDSVLNLSGVILTLSLVVITRAVVVEVEHAVLVELEEVQELVGQLPEPARRYLVEVLVDAVACTVGLSYYQTQHITEVHTAVDGLRLVQVTELPGEVGGLTAGRAVGVLVPLTELNIKTQVLTKSRPQPQHRFKKLVQLERAVIKSLDILRR